MGWLKIINIKLHSKPLWPVLLLSYFTDKEMEAQRGEVTCPKSHSRSVGISTQRFLLHGCWPPVHQWGWGLGSRALTYVHGVGVGQRLGRQDGVLQSFLIVGGWRLVIGIVFHRCLFFFVGGLIVTVILRIGIVVGTFLVIFFLPTA